MRVGTSPTNTAGAASGTDTAKLPHPQPQFAATSIIDACERSASALPPPATSAIASTMARSRARGARSGSIGVITLRSSQADNEEETPAGLVLVGFDPFTERLPRSAHHVQDILRTHSRYAALFGNRLLTILS